MAFGIVTVRTESGEYQEYELDKPLTSVGRQPGNDIVLYTSAVSRYHAQFDVSEGQVYLVDLETSNGTFVNDQQVTPGARVPLQNGDVITMGDMMLTFFLPEMPQRTDINLTPDITVAEDPNLPFRLTLDKPRQLVAPGARMQLYLLIENTTGQEHAFEIGLSGMSQAWAKANWKEVIVAGGEQTEVKISVLPPRSSETRPGRYPLVVRVWLKDDPNQLLEVVREIDVVSYAGLAVVASHGSQHGNYHIAIQNQGNVPMSVDLEGFDRRRALTYGFKPSSVDIGPGETIQASLRVRPVRRLGLSDDSMVDFAIIARSRDASGFQAPVAMTYDLDKAPAAVAGLALGGVTMAILGVILVTVVLGTLYLLKIWPFRKPVVDITSSPTSETAESTATWTAEPPTPTPVITVAPSPIPLPEIISFSAGAPDRGDVQAGSILDILRGETVTLSWLVRYPTEIVITDGTGREITRRNYSEATDVQEQASEVPPSLGKVDYTLSAGDQMQQLSVMVWLQCPIINPAPQTPFVFYEPLLPGEQLPDPNPHPHYEGYSGGEDVLVISRAPDPAWNSGADWILVAPGWGEKDNTDLQGWMRWAQLEPTCTGGVNPLNIAVYQGIWPPTP